MVNGLAWCSCHATASGIKHQIPNKLRNDELISLLQIPRSNTKVAQSIFTGPTQSEQTVKVPECACHGLELLFAHRACTVVEAQVKVAKSTAGNHHALVCFTPAIGGGIIKFAKHPVQLNSPEV